MARAARPATATVEWYLDKGYDGFLSHGPHSVTVPGAIDAWCRLLDDHGSKGIADAARAGDTLCRKGLCRSRPGGFRLGRQCSPALRRRACRSDLPSGRPGAAGRRLSTGNRNWRRLCGWSRSSGRAGFYEGEVADDMVARLSELGGLHALEDFAATAGRLCQTRQHVLPRLRHSSDAAEQSGHDGAADAEPAFGFRARWARPERRRTAASGDRGGAAGLPGPRQSHRRSEPRPGPREAAAVQLPMRTGCAPRSIRTGHDAFAAP